MRACRKRPGRFPFSDVMTGAPAAPAPNRISNPVRCRACCEGVGFQIAPFPCRVLSRSVASWCAASICCYVFLWFCYGCCCGWLPLGYFWRPAGNPWQLRVGGRVLKTYAASVLCQPLDPKLRSVRAGAFRAYQLAYQLAYRLFAYRVIACLPRCLPVPCLQRLEGAFRGNTLGNLPLGNR